MRIAKPSKPLNTTCNRNFAIRSRLSLACGIGAAAVASAMAPSAQAAVISPIAPSSVPTSNSASVFDVSHSGNVYQLDPSTSLDPDGFDLRDLFGGSFGVNSSEQNDVIFANGQPAGTVDTVEVTLAQPVSLSSFTLYLQEDASSGDHSASQFNLYADGQWIDGVRILPPIANESYDSVYHGDCIEISDTLADSPATADYTLQFVQNESASETSGVRALEFEATGTDVSLPEPPTLVGVLLGCIGLCVRRRRTH